MIARHNAAQSRYELDTEHGLAVASIASRANRAIFTHTECRLPTKARAIGARLVRAALTMRANAASDRTGCSFVAAFVRRHPEYNDEH